MDRKTPHPPLTGLHTPGTGSKYSSVWTGSSDFPLNTTHNIALAWDTNSSGNSKLKLWLDGKSVLSKSGLSLWSGDVYLKFGIYRGESGDHDTSGESNVFDLYVYKVRLSDASLEEVSEASGVTS